MKPVSYPPQPDLHNSYRGRKREAFEYFKRGGERRALIRKIIVALHVTEATASTWIQNFRRMT